MRILAPLLVLVGAIVGCTAGDSLAVATYTRNDNLEPFVLTTEPAVDPTFLMPVAGGENCSRLDRPWALVVYAGEVPGGPGQGLARITSDAFGRGPSAVWVHVLANGTVLTGIGVPVWWAGPMQTCS